MNFLKKPAVLVSAALFVLTMAIYAVTAGPTISFWDCGEFTETAYGLGIPHQPGTPLYVLVAHVFQLLPLGGSVAYRINLMSGFFAALAVVFTYLTALRLQQNWREEAELPSPPWLVHAGAATGALFLAFSTTFWNGAIEAEVYSMAAFVLALTGYMMVRWYEQRLLAASSMFLLLVLYVMSLSVGFHLGSVLVYPGFFVLAMLSRDKYLEDRDLLLVSAALGIFVAVVMLKLPTGVLFAGMGLVGVVALWRMLTPNGNAFALTGIALFMLGLSVHLFMMIRTTQDPFINQHVPDTLERMMQMMRREQYPPRVPWVREAPILWQLGHLFGMSTWGPETALQGRSTIGFLQQFTFLPRVGFLDHFVPIAMGLYGILSQFRGNRKLAWGFFTILLINSLGLLIVLNFTDHEVRDRDYFYFGAFQFWALFMALGAGGFLRVIWLGMRSRGSVGVWFTRGGAVLLLVIAVLPVLIPGHPKYFEHDRSHDYIARNYAYNMLSQLPENAILFTNGDNDTFPLWYLQGVENFRTDIRVVNLSLINVPWYIKQLRDVEPTVPITWSDRQIEGVDQIEHRGVRTPLLAQRVSDNEVLWVRDFAMWHIIEQNRWNRGIYFAVTIPPEYIQDYRPYFTMEGLVHRLTPTKNESGRVKVDPGAIMDNLSQNYDMRGIWFPTVDAPQVEPRLGRDVPFVRDDSFYKDYNTVHLSRNYPGALCRVGYAELTEGNLERGLAALELAFELDPTFAFLVDMLPSAYVQTGKLDRAVEVGRYYLDHLNDPRQMAVDLGRNLAALGHEEEALAWSRGLVERYPGQPEYLRLAARVFWQVDRRSEAIQLLEDFLRLQEDQEIRLDLDAMHRSMNGELAPEDSGETP